MDEKLVSTKALQTELIRKGVYTGLAEMALKKVPEAVVRCGNCVQWNELDDEQGVCFLNDRIPVIKHVSGFCDMGEPREKRRKK